MSIDVEALTTLLRHRGDDHVPLLARRGPPLPADRGAITPAIAAAWWDRVPGVLRRVVRARILSTPAEWRRGVTAALPAINASQERARAFLHDPVATLPSLGYVATRDLGATVTRARGRRRTAALPPTPWLRNLRFAVPGAPDDEPALPPTRRPGPTNPLGDFDLVLQIGLEPALRMVRLAFLTEPLRFGSTRVVVNRPTALTPLDRTHLGLEVEIAIGAVGAADPTDLTRFTLGVRLALQVTGATVSASIEQLDRVVLGDIALDREMFRTVIVLWLDQPAQHDLDPDLEAALRADAWGYFERQLRTVAPIALPAVGGELATRLGLPLPANAVVTEVGLLDDVLVIALAIGAPLGGVASLASDFARVRPFTAAPGHLALGLHERLLRAKLRADWDRDTRGKPTAGYDGPGELIFGRFVDLQITPGRLTATVRGRVRLGGDAFDWLVPDLNFDAVQAMVPVVDAATHVLRLVPIDVDIDVDDDDLVRMTLLLAVASAAVLGLVFAPVGAAIAASIAGALLAAMVVPAAIEVIAAGVDRGRGTAIPIALPLAGIGTLGVVGATATTDELLLGFTATYLPESPTLTGSIQVGPSSPPRWTEHRVVEGLERVFDHGVWRAMLVRRVTHRRAFALTFTIRTAHREGPSAIAWSVVFEHPSPPHEPVTVAKGGGVGLRLTTTVLALPPTPGVIQWRPVLRATVSDAFHAYSVELPLSPVWGADELVTESRRDPVLGDIEVELEVRPRLDLPIDPAGGGGAPG